ncbi:hypothetical protein LOK82_13600 [Xylella fastidiosa subsp. multiplex]|uniref:Uncharacterized protein n=1 Tax=Xylella fastidiosa subsp. multiplex TaxID=644357 RepID=A0AAW6HXS6_XYLFS|nr:hypothetical protein [Xylella fastidiosa subsp. multiplex]
MPLPHAGWTSRAALFSEEDVFLTTARRLLLGACFSRSTLPPSSAPSRRWRGGDFLAAALEQNR